jgi:hypothetical protein
VSARVETWCDFDHARAVVPSDHEVIDSTVAPRALVLDLAERGPALERDLFNACAVLGRLLAERGGSPTLVATSIEGARHALGAPPDASWLAPARAALLEGYAAAQADAARRDAAAAWEYPRCAVRLDEATIAIAPGYPEGDSEAVVAWASRVACAASTAGVRRAVVGDAPSAEAARVRAALVEALGVAGIEVTGSLLPSRASWLPWRRGPLVR